MAKKKKSRRKKQRPDGIDVQQRRRERLEARRQAKAEAEARALRAQRVARIRRRMFYLGIIAAGVWFVFFRVTTPSVIEGRLDDYEVLTFSTAGLNEHTTAPVDYETTPPVSGAHHPQIVPCGVHNMPVPDERMVHTLEHGAVAVFYQPDTPLEDIRAIEAIVGEFDEQTLAAPYPEMEPRIVVAAWARKIELSRFDEDAVRNFIGAFRGRGPEPGATCLNTEDRPFDPGDEEPEEGPGEEPPGEEGPGEEPPGEEPPGEGEPQD